MSSEAKAEFRYLLQVLPMCGDKGLALFKKAVKMLTEDEKIKVLATPEDARCNLILSFSMPFDYQCPVQPEDSEWGYQDGIKLLSLDEIKND